MKHLLFGLSWSLPFPTPELPTTEKSAQVNVVFGKFDDSTIHWKLIGVCYKAAPGAYFLAVPGVARFLVRDGNSIVIDALADIQIRELEHFLYNPVAGALLMQRGILPLRASVVEKNGQASILMGAAVAGKSLIAAGLMRQGYKVMTDSVCAIFPGNIPIVKAGPPELLLWSTALKELGYEPAHLYKARQNIEKYLLPVSDESYALEATVNSLFYFSRSFYSPYKETLITGRKKFIYLLELIYHNTLIDAFGVKQQLYPIIISLIQHSALTEISSPMQLQKVHSFIETFTDRHA